MVRVMLAAAAAFLVGCRSLMPAADATDRLVAAVTVRGWRAAGLPAPPARCDLERFRIEIAASPEEFARLCQHTVTESWACFVWRLEQHRAMGLYSRTYPAAIIVPGAASDVVMRLAVHELLHGLTNCALERVWSDSYDAGHTDVRVWLAKGSETAEARARRELVTGTGR
jgi:hypothetical protein